MEARSGSAPTEHGHYFLNEIVDVGGGYSFAAQPVLDEGRMESDELSDVGSRD